MRISDWSSDVCSSDLQGGDLHLRQAGEVAQLDHARQALVHRRQLGQGGIQAQHVLVQAQAALDVLGQVGDPVQVAAALLRQALAGVVDHHAAHGRGGIGEEVRAIVELGLAPADQLQVGLVDQRRSEEHTSELQSLMRISYAVFCLKKKNTKERISHDN